MRTLPIFIFKLLQAVLETWTNQSCILFRQHKVKPFHGARILFHGFTDDERQHMVSELVRNGGVECSQMGDPKCTHVVVDDANVTSLPQGLVAPNTDVPVVKSEWFWASIQVTMSLPKFNWLLKRWFKNSDSWNIRVVRNKSALDMNSEMEYYATHLILWGTVSTCRN